MGGSSSKQVSPTYTSSDGDMGAKGKNIKDLQKAALEKAAAERDEGDGPRP